MENTNCPLIVCITWRSGFRSEAGEWNLIHSRNLAFKSQNVDISMISVSRNSWWNDTPKHIKDAEYPILGVTYNGRFLGLIAALGRATIKAVKMRPAAIIYSGGLAGIFGIFARVAGSKTLCDIHGDSRSEASEYQRGVMRLITRFRFWVQDMIVSMSSGALVVTPEQAHLVSTHAKHTFIVPCACNVRLSENEYKLARAESRRDLNIPLNAKVMTHSGGVTAGWQCVGKYVPAFSLLSRSDPKLWLLILTGEINDAAALVDRYCPDPDTRRRVVIKSVPAARVVTTLCAADAGLLLREANNTNAVAFPNKIDEYLAAGLAIVTSNGLPAACRLVSNHNAPGIVLESTNLEDAGDFLCRIEPSEDSSVARWNVSQSIRDLHSFNETLKPIVNWCGKIK